jgi:dihydropteroate synthase
VLQAGRFRLALDRPRVMGIVNVTPDSFSDGGLHASTREALAHAERLLADGADILDIGGESTRPGAASVSLDEERARVLPVLRAALAWQIPLSIDTRHPSLMREALALGADLINDVNALRAPGAMEVLAKHPSAAVCLMHMKGEPGTMQQAPSYDGDDVLAAVTRFLRERREAALAAGIAADRLVLDPGIGFGKTAAHNWALLQRQEELHSLGAPLLIGWSRKSTLGAATDQPDASQRDAASVAAALLAVRRGAHLLRVHNVRATVDALKVWACGGALAAWPESQAQA